MNEHVGELILERLGVVGRCEVAVVLAPGAPGGGEASDGLTGGTLRTELGVAVVVEDRVALVVDLGDAGFAEVLGDDDVGGDL